MKIYDLIVENLILLFFFTWSCYTVCFRFIYQNSRWLCFDFLSSSFSVPLQNLSLVVSSSFFSSLALLELGFVGTDYLDYWLFGFLCCTNHRDDLFLGVQTSCIFDIHVVKVCETRFLYLPTF